MKCRYPLQPFFEKHPELEPRKIGSDATMRSHVKGHMSFPSPRSEVVGIRKRIRIEVNRWNQQQQLIALTQLYAFVFHVTGHRSHGHRDRMQSQQFLYD